MYATDVNDESRKNHHWSHGHLKTNHVNNFLKYHKCPKFSKNFITKLLKHYKPS